LNHWQTIATHISQATSSPFKLENTSAAGGGSINNTHVLAGSGKKFFVKQNNASLLWMFEAEAAGLIELAKANALHIPQAICWGIDGSYAYLVLEHVTLQHRSDSMVKLGQQLAALHQTTQDRYGWFQDNTIGSTRQINTYESNWVEFYAKHRLGYQLTLAEKNGGNRLIQSGEKLINQLADFFTDYQPKASLLHGDLWSGNMAADEQGQPVIFDPAVYFGDREADIAMTELFGGFGQNFYASYHAAYPLDAGYKVRKTLYNLYHIINHFNLFGGGYLPQAANMIDQLLSEIRG
jgi:protein-ribulosamine 3-kinase